MAQLLQPSAQPQQRQSLGRKYTVARCPECGGPRRGPRAHQPDCSHYRKSPVHGSVADKLGTMDVFALASLRTEIDKIIASKRTEIDAKIASLQAILRK